MIVVIKPFKNSCTFSWQEFLDGKTSFLRNLKQEILQDFCDFCEMIKYKTIWYKILKNLNLETLSLSLVSTISLFLVATTMSNNNKTKPKLKVKSKDKTSKKLRNLFCRWDVSLKLFLTFTQIAQVINHCGYGYPALLLATTTAEFICKAQ